MESNKMIWTKNGGGGRNLHRNLWGSYWSDIITTLREVQNEFHGLNSLKSSIYEGVSKSFWTELITK